MSDEDRRLLEREARYDSAISGLLTCLREGHLATRDGSSSVWAVNSPLAPDGTQGFEVKWGGSHSAMAYGCSRCGLVFWSKTTNPYVPGIQGVTQAFGNFGLKGNNDED